MRLSFEYTSCRRPEWRETLKTAFDMGVPSLLDLDWLIDRIEHDEWGGLWW
jgi:hypothetical protein